MALLVALLLTACTARSDRPSPSPSTAAAPVFHVDCSSAAADGTGSLARPWTSLDAVAKHGVFHPGEAILLRRGTVCSGRIAPTGSGENGRPIRLGAYGAGAKPVVNGGGTPTGTGTVQLTDQHDWVIEGLAVTNLLPSGVDDTFRMGIAVLSQGVGTLRNIEIRDDDVHDVTSNPAVYPAGGIAVVVRPGAGTGPGAGARAGAAASLDAVTIEGNTVDHVGRTGIVLWAEGYPAARITDASVLHNSVLHSDGDSILLSGVEHAAVEWNVSRDGGHLPPCPACAVPARTQVAGIWPIRARDIAIRYNEVSGENASGGDGEGFDVDLDTDGVMVEGNYSHDNGGGGVLLCGARNATVRFNVLQNDGGGEINFSCPTQYENIRITNNDLLLAPDSPTAVVRRVEGTGTAPILFANNLVMNGASGAYAWPSPVTATNNAFSGGTAPAAPLDAAAVGGDPQLTAPGAGTWGLDSLAGLRPRPGSSLLASGAPIEADATEDFAGAAVTPGRPPRGAFTLAAPPAVPPVPASPTLTAIRGGVRASWPAAPGRTTELQRAANARGPFRVVVAALTTNSFDDTGLPPRSRWYYRLVARDRAGASAASPAVSAVVR